MTTTRIGDIKSTVRGLAGEVRRLEAELERRRTVKVADIRKTIAGKRREIKVLQGEATELLFAPEPAVAIPVDETPADG